MADPLFPSFLLLCQSHEGEVYSGEVQGFAYAEVSQKDPSYALYLIGLGILDEKGSPDSCLKLYVGWNIFNVGWNIFNGLIQVKKGRGGIWFDPDVDVKGKAKNYASDANIEGSKILKSLENPPSKPNTGKPAGQKRRTRKKSASPELVDETPGVVGVKLSIGGSAGDNELAELAKAQLTAITKPAGDVNKPVAKKIKRQ